MSVVEAFGRALSERGYVADPAQVAAAQRLQGMDEEFVAYKARSRNRLPKPFTQPPVPRGVLVYGGGGLRENFLMDCL